jgi:hypothetical protein
MKKDYIDNESGVAYVFFMIVALLIIGSILWMGVSYGMNNFNDIINDRIANGEMSTQTRGSIAFGMSMLQAVPIIFLGGCFVYAVMAGVNKRNEGG